LKDRCNKKNMAVLLAAVLVSAALTGCATTSGRNGMDVTRINGRRYIELGAFCGPRGVKTSYDPVTRVATLSKSGHQVRMVVDDTCILIDGVFHNIRTPVAYSQGSVHIPYHFYRDVLDGLFERRPMVICDYLERPGFGRIKKIVIDAGHGGKDPGAIGRTGLREKDVTLDISKRLADLLSAEGVETSMVRSTDRFVPLEERVKIGNRPGNSLFVSIHANANPSRSMRGFEVYYMTPRISDTERAFSCARNEQLELGGSFAGTPSLDLKALLWDMVHTYNRAKSILLSKSLCKATGCSLDTRIIGVKSANYHVLRGSAIPAVLVEVGFLSNASEEQMLKDGSYRQRVAQAIHDGIKDFAHAGDSDSGGQTALLRSAR